jgi:hypothetical protein
MREKPNRPPEISTDLALPTEETVKRLHEIAKARAPTAEDVRLIAGVLAHLNATVEAVVHASRALPPETSWTSSHSRSRTIRNADIVSLLRVRASSSLRGSARPEKKLQLL